MPPRVTCLAYGMGGRLLATGRNCGRIQVRVAAAYRGGDLAAFSFSAGDGNPLELEAMNAKARAAHRWLLGRERITVETKAHASAVLSIDLSVVEAFDPMVAAGEENHGSKRVNRYENVAFRCALKSSDVSREVCFFQVNLISSTVEYVVSSENAQSTTPERTG